MGSQKKRFQSSTVKKTDIRKKANKDERREAKHLLSEGHYEGWARSKKFSRGRIEFDD